MLNSPLENAIQITIECTLLLGVIALIVWISLGDKKHK